jgi:hypothetical protein
VAQADTLEVAAGILTGPATAIISPGVEDGALISSTMIATNPHTHLESARADSVACRKRPEPVRDQVHAESRPREHDGGRLTRRASEPGEVVASGWQGDLEPGGGRETLVVPIATHLDGTSITGPVVRTYPRHSAVDTPAPHAPNPEERLERSRRLTLSRLLLYRPIPGVAHAVLAELERRN